MVDSPSRVSAGPASTVQAGTVQAGTGRSAWAGIGWAVVVLAVLVGVVIAAIVVWVIPLENSAGQLSAAAIAAPPVATPGTGASTSNGANGPSAGASSPLDQVDRTWAARAASATGIGGRAFLAYASADLTLERERPACGLGWNTLAAIATVESANGTYGGVTVRSDGYTSRPIVGVPLDGGTFGGGRVAAIPDTDHGKLDGDPRWDHAVGPFQFLPATWARWGADGNGDGVSSPNQIDDAALAAARYLCASGPMTTVAGWRSAVLSYNHSDAYANEVAAIANRYAAETSGLS
jgi:hypothetical protein